MVKRSASQSAARRARASKNASRSSHLSHHQRKCVICHHPDRDMIEEMFLHWHSPSKIHCRFLLSNRSTIYDHAHATGLFAKRRRNMRYALENIIERSDEAPISSNGIVTAIKAYASLTNSGEWIEPARRIIYTSVSSPSAPPREVPGPSPNPLANKNARRGYAGTRSDPSETGDGWYTRNAENSPAVYSAAQRPYSVYLEGSQAQQFPRSDQKCQPAPAPPSAAHMTTASGPASSASAPVAAGTAPQATTQHSPAPSQATTTATPTNPGSPANPGNDRKITPQHPNSNRYTSGLKIPPSQTKQTPVPHLNRYK